MSQTPKKFRADAAERKQKQRARLRESGKSELSIWFTLPRKVLLNDYAKKLELPLVKVAEMVLEFATPLYLREIDKRLTEVIPLIQKLRTFEHYGVGLSPAPVPAVQIGSGAGFIVLDPYEHYQTREKVNILLQQLGKYGLPSSLILKLIPPLQIKASSSKYERFIQ